MIFDVIGHFILFLTEPIYAGITWLDIAILGGIFGAVAELVIRKLIERRKDKQ